MHRLRALVLVVGWGCVARAPVAPTQAVAPPRVDEPAAARREPAPIAAAAGDATPSTPQPTTLLAITAEWDATPGPDAIVLHPDGRVVAGDEEGRASLPTSSGYFFEKQARMEVVELGDAKFERALVLAIPTADEEDPANVYQVFVADGGALRKIYEATIGTYGVVPLVFAGDGTMTYVEDGWTACQRAKFPTAVALKTVVLRVGKDGMLAEVKRTKTKETQKCGELAACPFVYVLGDGAPALQGEILRNLRGLGAYDAQSLTLAVPKDGELRIRIAEEKDEVTHLDAITLVVDGVEVPPRACSSDAAPRFCTADRTFELLRRGDALELVFDVRRDAQSIELRATGYYGVPRS